MNTNQTLTNAQLFLSTKLVTRLEHSSSDEFTHVDAQDLLADIMYEIDSFNPKDNDDIHYLRERITEQFDSDCLITRITCVINALTLLLIYSQEPGSNATIYNITNQISQRLIKATDYI